MSVTKKKNQYVAPTHGAALTGIEKLYQDSKRRKKPSVSRKK